MVLWLRSSLVVGTSSTGKSTTVLVHADKRAECVVGSMGWPRIIFQLLQLASEHSEFTTFRPSHDTPFDTAIGLECRYVQYNTVD